MFLRKRNLCFSPGPVCSIQVSAFDWQPLPLLYLTGTHKNSLYHLCTKAKSLRVRQHFIFRFSHSPYWISMWDMRVRRVLMSSLLLSLFSPRCQGSRSLLNIFHGWALKSPILLAVCIRKSWLSPQKYSFVSGVEVYPVFISLHHSSSIHDRLEVLTLVLTNNREK